MLPERTALLISIAIGVTLEVGVTLASGRREAWDAGDHAPFHGWDRRAAGAAS